VDSDGASDDDVADEDVDAVGGVATLCFDLDLLLDVGDVDVDAEGCDWGCVCAGVVSSFVDVDVDVGVVAVLSLAACCFFHFFLAFSLNLLRSISFSLFTFALVASVVVAGEADVSVLLVAPSCALLSTCSVLPLSFCFAGVLDVSSGV
jgi:hypothetical protein